MKCYRVVKDHVFRSFKLEGTRGKLLTDANNYLQMIEARGLSVCTTRAYAYDLLSIFEWLNRIKKRFKSLTQRDIVDFIKYQKMNHSKPRSINRRLTTFEAFYRFCYNFDIPHVKGMSYPTPHYRALPRDRNIGLFRYRRKHRLKFRVKVPRTLVDSMDAKEVNKFLEGISRYRDISIIYLMLFCGLRASEVLSLLLDDVNFSERQIRIRGKGNKERVLPLAPDLVTVLEKYLRLEKPSSCKERNFFVVLQGKRKSHPMTYAGLRSLFRYNRNLSGIKKANPHRFRHVFGTSMAREGVQLPVLQKMMGHADGQTTLQYINLSMKDIASEYHQAIQRIRSYYEKN